VDRRKCKLERETAEVIYTSGSAPATSRQSKSISGCFATRLLLLSGCRRVNHIDVLRLIEEQKDGENYATCR
jgi:hypothetical protein